MCLNNFGWALNLGIFGRSFFESLRFPRNMMVPPQHTDSHPCTRPRWSCSLSWWSRSHVYTFTRVYVEFFGNPCGILEDACGFPEGFLRGALRNLLGISETGIRTTQGAGAYPHPLLSFVQGGSNMWRSFINSGEKIACKPPK